jgi:hydrogenase maturation protein HypF
LKALKIMVRGIVQGVGFRPFIYRIALRCNLYGYVKNISGSAVEIHVEGEESNLKQFLRLLNEEKPSVAEIDEISIVEIPLAGYNSFSIMKSDITSHYSSMIPPDIAICDECLQEVLDPNSRWYNYPFHSCAYCGPRYSIIEKLPYDRVNTSMNDFPLCSECLFEYHDPNNRRRFHAQGISCPKCGPIIWLADKNFNKIQTNNPIYEAAKLLDEGYIIALKGLGGFHIAALASDDDVVRRLRILKNRPTKPFAVMALNIEIVSQIAQLNDRAKLLLLSQERPIVLLEKLNASPLSELIAPGLKHVGIFLPYTALHYLLLNNTKDKFAIMTSGNPPGETMCIDETCAREKLHNYVDYFLLHNRRIVNRVDDSVVRFTNGNPMLLRRGRGYAPRWIQLPFKLEKPIIAFGAMLQNTGAVAFEDKAILTQYIGDVDEFSSYQELAKYLRLLMENYKINVTDPILVCDLHPRYPTTIMAEQWSKKYNNELVRVQHHWAHITSVMAEYGLHDEYIGIAIDGAGFGTDGNIWGGEILRVSYNNFERIGHLQLQKMPGGDLATLYPSRMLISILSTFLSEKEIFHLIKNLGILDKGLPHKEKEFNIIMRQINNSPLTSSIGRVLDATAALLGISYYRSYEGEPAMKLEAFAEPSSELLDPKIELLESNYIINTSHLFKSILELLDSQKREKIAYMMQYSLGQCLGTVINRIAKTKDKYVIISGGAAVNDYIIKGLADTIKIKGLEFLLPKQLPANDGGIPLGQIAVASNYFKK